MIVQVNHTQNINKMNIYITRNQSWAVVSYENSELLYWANFPGASARAPLFFERNNGCSSELSPFYRYRYSLLWREWWLKEKVLKSSSVSTRW